MTVKCQPNPQNCVLSQIEYRKSCVTNSLSPFPPSPRVIQLLLAIVIAHTDRLIGGKWFEPKSISCLSSVTVRVRVVFRKTVGKLV